MKQLTYWEKCVCGAEICLTDKYEYFSNNEVRQFFKEWSAMHSKCVGLFFSIQKAKLQALEIRNSKALEINNKALPSV